MILYKQINSETTGSIAKNAAKPLFAVRILSVIAKKYIFVGTLCIKLSWFRNINGKFNYIKYQLTVLLKSAKFDLIKSLMYIDEEE